MADPFAGTSEGPATLGTRGAVIVPDDATDLTTVAKAVVVRV